MTEQHQQEADCSGTLAAAAVEYAELGYSVFPCKPGGKTPATATGFKEATTDVEQVRQWWSRNPYYNIGIATGALFVLDFDAGNNWLQDDPDRLAELANGCPISLTANAGRHYFYREPEGHQWGISAGKLDQQVDTRGHGGYVVVPPSRLATETGFLYYNWSPEFELTASVDELSKPPEWLVVQLDELEATKGHQPKKNAAKVTEGLEAIPNGQRNATLTSHAGALRNLGWDSEEILGGLRAVNASRCKPPLDDSELNSIARSIARYEPGDFMRIGPGGGLLFSAPDPDDTGKISDECHLDPGLIPEELLNVPGFIKDVMTFSITTAPYPNEVLSFCGAMALMSFLCGRKVKTEGGMRGNIYILGLAPSGAGKDHPRKVNSVILDQVGFSDAVGDQIASAEGLEDAMQSNPSFLLQTDEIDTMLQSISKSKDARHENIMNILLRLFSSSDSAYRMRRKAGNDNPLVIYNPNLVILGTAIPTFYYSALSERMLTNGFFSRTMALEGYPRSPRNYASGFDEIPECILEVARWWAEFNPGGGNLDQVFATQQKVYFSHEARKRLKTFTERSEAEYRKHEIRQDPVGTALFARVDATVEKLALLYACSENHERPEISEQAVEWAAKVVDYLVQRMLWMVQQHVSENAFDADRKKVLAKIKAKGGPGAPFKLKSGELLESLNGFDKDRLHKVIETMVHRGEVTMYQGESSGGRPPTFIELTKLGEAKV
ncbi:MAG: bifunctional DNA primase/polymerase [Planctomycetaceae bacterium]|nr:bifunctional DNA primase/polymerase [Planctomycetaceae bacterium]